MTTKQERSDRSYIDPVTNQKGVYYLGLSEAEAKTLRNLLGTSLSTGRLSTQGARITHSIYQKVNTSLKSSEENSDDLNLQQQNKELKHRLQECRRKLNELEDSLEVGEVLV